MLFGNENDLSRDELANEQLPVVRFSEPEQTEQTRPKGNSWQEKKYGNSDRDIERSLRLLPSSYMKMAVSQIKLSLPALPEGWSAEKDFKAVGHLSTANQRNVEPVGPHFLAHARRVS